MMKRILSIIGLIIGVFSVVCFSQTYHTITIDGNKNDWDDAKEKFTTSSGGYFLRFTWDENNLYIAYEGNDIGAGASGTKWVLVYIDTDPQLTPTSGTGTTQAQQYNTQTWNLPFTANYHLRWKTNDTYINMGRWTGSSWDYGTGSGYWTGSKARNASINFVEISIPRADLGNPSQIYILAYMINEQSFGEGSYASWPDNSLRNGDGYKNPGYFDHWYGYTLTAGQTPNDGSNYDRSLPAQFVSLVAITGNSKVTLVWETGSEFNNAGFEIYRKAQDETDFKYIAGYQTNPELRGLGTSSHGKRYTYTDENVKGGATYVYKIYAVDFNGNRQEFGSITVNVVAEIPNKYVLYQNYPNPFNPGTEIRFDLPKSGNVKLEIFNSLGEKVAVLYDGFMEAGYGKVVRWNANGFPSGVYYYRLTADGFVDVKKMVLMK
jgi:hypothetical protein